MNNILLYVYHILLTDLSTDRQLECFHLLAIVNNSVWDIRNKYLSETLPSNLLGMYMSWSVWTTITKSHRLGDWVAETTEIYFS